LKKRSVADEISFQMSAVRSVEAIKCLEEEASGEEASGKLSEVSDQRSVGIEEEVSLRLVECYGSERGQCWRGWKKISVAEDISIQRSDLSAPWSVV